MSTSAVRRAKDQSEREKLVSDLFHALNQPITSLRCVLELALCRERNRDEYVEALRNSMALAEQISLLAGAVRELVQGDGAGKHPETLCLGDRLREAVEDCVPVASAGGVHVSQSCETNGQVLFDAEQLRQALFHLLEFMLQSTESGGDLEIETKECDGQAVLSLTATPPHALTEADNRGSRARELWQRVRFEIARNIFAASGSTVRTEYSRQRLELRVFFPLVP